MVDRTRNDVYNEIIASLTSLRSRAIMEKDEGRAGIAYRLRAKVMVLRDTDTRRDEQYGD